MFTIVESCVRTRPGMGPETGGVSSVPVLLRPEPGEIVRWDANSAVSPDYDRSTPESRNYNIPVWDASETASTRGLFRIGLVEGRYIGDDFDNSVGGSLDYWAYQRREGSNMEKLYAAIMLSDTRPTFSSITRQS